MLLADGAVAHCACCAVATTAVICVTGRFGGCILSTSAPQADAALLASSVFNAVQRKRGGQQLSRRREPCRLAGSAHTASLLSQGPVTQESASDKYALEQLHRVRRREGVFPATGQADSESFVNFFLIEINSSVGHIVQVC